MQRKKWTPKVEIKEADLKFREKRKWQLALRRYVVEMNISAAYACYFGLSINQFRKWIEIQFEADLNWENFGSAWQFDHIIPVAYFDFSREDELELCWNFMNIRVARIEERSNKRNRIDVIVAKSYFEALYRKTNFDICLKMLAWIGEIEVSVIIEEPAIEGFIIQNKEYLDNLSTLTREEFNKLNTGMSIEDILLERAIIQKFG